MPDLTTNDDAAAAADELYFDGFQQVATGSADLTIGDEVPSNEDYERINVDSRPPYTVDEDQRRLVVLNTASADANAQIHESDDLFAERTADAAGAVPVGRTEDEVLALPTFLSSRMRVKRAVQLALPVRTPAVSIKTNANAPALSVESEGIVELPVGERTEVRLDPITAEARTSHVVGEASIDGVPEFQQGLEREQGSVEIEATPVVEAVNHGGLLVEEQPPSPK